jgi:hypothetical protein
VKVAPARRAGQGCTQVSREEPACALSSQLFPRRLERSSEPASLFRNPFELGKRLGLHRFDFCQCPTRRRGHISSDRI